MKEKETSQLRSKISYLFMIIAAALIGYVISRCVIINAVIPSESMEDLLHKRDLLIGFRQAYLLTEPERYDVVMFHYPLNEQTIYIKRIIGLPGETVTIREGQIYIDDAGLPLEEDYLPEEWTDWNDGYVFEIPQECYLMLGDNRNVSEDARFWPEIAMEEGLASGEEDAQRYAYVEKGKIVAQAVLKYYPNFMWLQ